jgi:hypothetical protein
MSDFDWKAAVRGVAPALAGVLGGPAAGLGVKVLADVFLGGSSGDQAADEAKIGEIMAGGMTPEIQARILEANNALKIEIAKLGVETRRLEVDETKAYLADTQNARDSHKDSTSVIRAALAINIFSYVLIAAVLYGAFSVLSGVGGEVKIDPGLAAMVGGIIGAAVQWIMQNSAQANGFLFGSSPSARANAQRMAEAVETAVKRGPQR